MKTTNEESFDEQIAQIRWLGTRNRVLKLGMAYLLLFFLTMTMAILFFDPSAWVFGLLLLGQLVAMVDALALTGFFFVHLFRNPRPSGTTTGLWIVGFMVQPLVATVAYYFLEVFEDERHLLYALDEPSSLDSDPSRMVA